MIGWCFLGAFASLILLSCAPWTLRFTVASSPRWSGQMDVSWAGMLNWRRSLFLPSAPPTVPKQASAAKGLKPRGKASRPAVADVLSAVRHAGRYAVRFVAQTEIQDLRLHCSAGLEDPADTAALYGALAPLFLLCNSRDNCRVELQPQFHEEGLEFHGRGQVLLRPIRYFLVLFQLVIDPSSWRLAAALLRR